MRSAAFVKLIDALLLAWPVKEREQVMLEPTGTGYHVHDESRPIVLTITLDIPGKTIKLEGGN